MSILLDALKKSEAQRKLGETPTLQTPAYEDNSASGPGQPWIPVVMMVLTLGVITWIGLKQYSESEVTVLNESETIALTDVGVESSPPDEATSIKPRQPATTPVMDYQAEDRDSESSPGPARASQQRPAPETGRSIASTRGPAQPPTPDKPADPAPDSEQAVVSGDDSLPALPDEELVNPYQSEVLSYWQIPQDLRDSMPEMRISVLVYAERPEDRFLLIDGERLREKEELTNGLVLEEIKNDRAIFTYRNYRFHVKS